jgi:hypothetical protein
MNLIASLLDPVIGALRAGAPLPVMRDGTDRDHVIASPPLTAAQAIEWIFEGRANPPEDRFRPDPQEGPPDGPQRRFLFQPTPDEFAEASADFAKRWLDSGPGWTLEDRLQAIAWLPAAIADDIVALDQAGAFRRTCLPFIKRYPDTSEGGRDTLAWVGPGEFLSSPQEVLIFQYFPQDLQTYLNVADGDAHDANMLWNVFQGWNEDMRHFVEQNGMRPDAGKERLVQIWGEIFRAVLEAAASIAGFGAAVGGLNQIAELKEQTLASVLESYQANRQLFSMWARSKSLFQIMFRGTTALWKLGDLLLDETHDLGQGTYFTDSQELAEIYGRRFATADDPGILLRIAASEEDLGDNVLNLVSGPSAQEWNAVVAEARSHPVSFINERYNNALSNFLMRQGKQINDYDAIIAGEYNYSNGGTQICIKNPDLLRKLLQRADEIPLE